LILLFHRKKLNLLISLYQWSYSCSKPKTVTNLGQVINNFVICTRNLSIRLEETLQKELLRLKKLGLSPDFYDKVYPTGRKIGCLYGLPKIHKLGVRVRPILSASSMYNTKRAKILVDTLMGLILIKIFGAIEYEEIPVEEFGGIPFGA